MINNILADLYEQGIRKWIEELSSFKNEENLWRTVGSIKNSAGNLVLHIIGGTNYLIGSTLANTGYVRNRDQEFIQKDIDRSVLEAQLEALIPMVTQTIRGFSPQELEADYPFMFDNAINSKAHVLTLLLAHLNYHLGQVNYIRRVLE